MSESATIAPWMFWSFVFSVVAGCKKPGRLPCWCDPETQHIVMDPVLYFRIKARAK